MFSVGALLPAGGNNVDVRVLLKNKINKIMGQKTTTNQLILKNITSLFFWLIKVVIEYFGIIYNSGIVTFYIN